VGVGEGWVGVSEGRVRVGVVMGSCWVGVGLMLGYCWVGFRVIIGLVLGEGRVGIGGGGSGGCW
jgi:hypothetical protein